jgi:hypothetical protein
MARERAQASVQRSQLDVQRVDHRERDGDLLARGA